MIRGYYDKRKSTNTKIKTMTMTLYFLNLNIRGKLSIIRRVKYLLSLLGSDMFLAESMVIESLSLLLSGDR